MTAGPLEEVLCSTVYFSRVARSHTSTCRPCPASPREYRRCQRSAARGDLAVPVTRTAHYGPRSFAVIGRSSRDSLPASLRDH